MDEGAIWDSDVFVTSRQARHPPLCCTSCQWGCAEYVNCEVCRERETERDANAAVVCCSQLVGSAIAVAFACLFLCLLADIVNLCTNVVPMPLCFVAVVRIPSVSLAFL